MDVSAAAIKDRLSILLEQIRALTVQIEEVERDTPSKPSYPIVDNLRTEKQILTRELRAERNSVRDEWSRLMRGKEEKDNRKKYDDKVASDQQARRNTRRTALGTVIEDNRDPVTKTEGSQYIRSQNMCVKYQESITKTADDVDKLLSEEPFGISQTASENRQILIESKINSMKQMTIQYKKHHEQVTNLGKADTLQIHIESLQNVLELSTLLEAKLKLDQEKDKKKLALSKTEALEGMKMQKFSGLGDSRYLNYYNFYQEFKELVLQKEYSESTKLKYLKLYTEKDAHNICQKLP